MNYKAIYKKIDKLLTNLQSSMDLEESYFILEDRAKLIKELSELNLNTNSTIIEITVNKDKENLIKLIDECFFYINLASDDLQKNLNNP